jgi:hypothetical protein
MAPWGTPIPCSVPSIVDDVGDDGEHERVEHNVHILNARRHKVAGLYQRGGTSVATFIRWLDGLLDVAEPWMLSATGDAAALFGRDDPAIMSEGEYVIVGTRQYIFLGLSRQLTSWKGVTAPYRRRPNLTSVRFLAYPAALIRKRSKWNFYPFQWLHFPQS